MQTEFTYPTVDAFLAAVGRKELQTRIGKTTNLMTRAKEDGVFPDGWYWSISSFCEESGYDVPVNLFRSHPYAAQAIQRQRAEIAQSRDDRDDAA